jgi:hypothetical protein
LNTSEMPLQALETGGPEYRTSQHLMLLVIQLFALLINSTHSHSIHLGKSTSFQNTFGME